MPTPTLFSISIEPLLLKEAQAVLAQAGLTPEQAIVIFLERTAREGALPLKKSRSRHRSTPQVQSELFKQSNLFEHLYYENTATEGINDACSSKPDLSSPSLSSLLARDSERLAQQRDAQALTSEDDLEQDLLPNMTTLSALQDAQARLCWRARQREETSREEVPKLFRETNGAKLLIESKFFYKDKAQIMRAPNTTEIIKALEKLFDQITIGKVPQGARPLYGNNTVFWAPLGSNFPHLGIIYEAHDEDVCLIRYGLMSELFNSIPSSSPQLEF